MARALRGIYWFRLTVDGCNAWYALDSRGALVPPGIRLVWPGESDAIVVDELATALDRADPIRAPRPAYLQLVRDPEPARTPLPIPSGVSPAVALLVAREQQLA